MKLFLPLLTFTVSLVVTLFGQASRAACSSPTANQGAKHYVYTSHKYQYCDGTNWQDMPIQGTIAGACTEGNWKFDTTANAFKYCDGTVYHQVACERNYCANPDWTAPLQKSRFVESDPKGSDYFGNSISVSGTLALVGAYEQTNTISGQGAAYLFDVSAPASPVQKAKLVQSDAATGDFFGNSVALSGSLALIGAESKNVGVNGTQGVAYVFDVSNPASPVQKAEITASDGASGDYFGSSVAISGNYALVGAYDKTIGSNTAQGAVYLFDVSNPASPVQKARITASDGVANDYFGYSIAISGNVVLIGAYHKTVGANSSQGVTYVFDVSNPASPVQKSEITTSDGAAGDDFGASVSLSGTLALIGANFKTVGANTNQGAAYIFDVSNPVSPVQKSEITSSDGASTDLFGTHLALSGSLAVVGAQGKTVGSNRSQGEAYIYDLTNPASPVQKSKVTASDGAASDQFGYDVGASSTLNVAVIGAYKKTIGTNTSQGAVYLFQPSCQAACSSYSSWNNSATQARITSSDGSLDDYFASSLALSGTTALIGAYYKNVGANSQQGEAYLVDLSNSSSPVQKSILTASDGASSDEFGTSVALSGNLALVGAEYKQIGTNVGQGAAYVFDVSNPASPVQKARITASDANPSDDFGVSVSLSGTIGVIGAFNKLVGTNGSQGAAYVFDFSNPASPVQESELNSSDGATSDYFGAAVALSGSLAVVGAYNKTVGGNSAQGEAYVFDLSNPASPVQKSILLASDGTSSSFFGYSVAVSGNLAVVGAYLATVGANPGQGAAYVYDLSNPASPVQKAKLTASDGASNDYFGFSVSISGNYAVVGAYQKTVSGHPSQGTIYVFDLTNPASPVQMAELTNSDGANYDELGNSTAISGNLIVAGADDKNMGANSAQGAAYAFSPPCNSIACSTNGSCTASYPQARQGSLHYVPGSYFEYCDGTNWLPISCGTTSLLFTNQSELNPSTLTTSNIFMPTVSCDSTVSISGTGSPQFRICADSGCNTVVHTWGTASQSILPGQYIQLELTSSASYNTTNSATVTVGSASTTWNATTWLGYKRVFVTPQIFPGNFGSVAAADHDCQIVAQEAGLSGTWKAWLAITTGTDDPATTFTHSTYPYKDVNGTTTIANNWAGLISGTLLAGISTDSTESPVSGNAWTNVATNGTATTSGSSTSSNCTGWTNNSGGSNKGKYGVIGSATSTWTASSAQTCSTSAHLYCFEQ